MTFFDREMPCAISLELEISNEINDSDIKFSSTWFDWFDLFSRFFLFFLLPKFSFVRLCVCAARPVVALYRSTTHYNQLLWTNLSFAHSVLTVVRLNTKTLIKSNGEELPKMLSFSPATQWRRECMSATSILKLIINNKERKRAKRKRRKKEYMYSYIDILPMRRRHAARSSYCVLRTASWCRRRRRHRHRGLMCSIRWKIFNMKLTITMECLGTFLWKEFQTKWITTQRTTKTHTKWRRNRRGKREKKRKDQWKKVTNEETKNLFSIFITCSVLAQCLTQPYASIHTHAQRTHTWTHARQRQKCA